jgi:hypothetical protein
VPIYRILSEREGVQEKGRSYKDAVIDFMEATGYMEHREAEIHPSLDDIQFRHKGSGEWVIAEAKGSKLSPNDFRSELARYYLEYTHRPKEQRFDFFIFAEELGYPQLWSDLFEKSYTDNDKIEEFLSQLEKKLDDEKLSQKIADTYVEDFETFAIDTHVHEADYLELKTVAMELQESDRFNYEPYLHSFEPIKEQHDYATNLFHVTSFPDNLYIYDTAEGLAEARYYNYNNQHYPVVPEAGKLYTLVEKDRLPGSTKHYIGSDSPEVVDFKNWISEGDSPERTNIVRELLLGVISVSAQKNDCIVERSRGRHIYPIYDENRHHGKRTDSQNRWLAQELSDRSEIRHRAVDIRVEKYADEFYYVLTPTQEFTWDGREKVTGERKSELQDKFSPNRFQGQNSKQLRQIRIWPKILMLTINTGLSRWMDGDQLPAIQKIEAEQVQGLTLGIRPPKDGDEQSRIIDGVIDE